MLGLFYKDFLIMKKELLLNFLAMIGCSILMFLPWENILEANGMVTDVINGETMTFVIMPLIAYFFIFGTISGLQNNLFSGDERKGYSAFITATPITAKGQVLSKYYETLFLSFLGIIWGTVCDLISSLVSGTMGSAINIYLTLFFIQILLRAIDMPFLIRFGQKHGKIVKLLMVAVITLIGIVYRLFGKLPDMNSDSLFAVVLLWLINEKNLSAFMLGVVSLAPYVAVILFYLSYRISVKIYQKGVENYDH